MENTKNTQRPNDKPNSETEADSPSPRVTPGIHFADIDGQKLRYEVSGNGRPLVLMHGWGCSLETVRSVAAEAAKTHTVYNIDFPGFGQSPEPSEVWGVEEYTRLIEKFIRHLGLERPVLAGHSFGGRVSILLSSRNEVDKVVLIDAAGVKPSRSLKYYAKVYRFKAYKWVIKHTLPKQKAESLIRKMRNKRGSADYNSASDRMKAILSKVVNEDLTPVMDRIKAPTLLIWGANDTATPLKDAKKMEKLIPDSGLVVFENAGHYSFLDNAHGFRAVLSSFLRS